jgi:hypothetical protein
MKNYLDIQTEIDNAFKDYLFNLLQLDGQRLKYYYWSKDFFETVGSLSFKYFVLTNENKDSINLKGDFYFDSGNAFFEINKNSQRHDMTIKNYNKLFTSYSSKIPQTNRYEYIKEFILWDILLLLNKNKEIEDYIVKQQKKNFLHTYLLFLLENTARPNYPEFSDYINYPITTQGEDLIKKISFIESTKNIRNGDLFKKINSLFIHKEDETKLHFVFSREGGEEKEELRELLDVMGREKTGKLYRGQANSSWKLDSSLTRESKYFQSEAEMYYEILSLKPDSFANDHTVYERLITMQHFGMPTRLMDITRNPLVAIFFACNNLERADSDGIIYTFAQKDKDILNFEDERLKSLKYLFDKSNVNKNDVTKDAFLSKIWFIRGVAKNQRINNQSGDFIFVGASDDIEEKLIELPSLNIIIDSKSKKTLLEQLDSLNIHGGAVYPDLTHMSNYIRNKYLNDKAKNGTDLIKLIVKPINKGIVNKTKKLSKEESKALFDKHFNKKEEAIVIKTLVNQFDKKTFWTKSRLSKLKAFAKKEKLKEDGFIELMNTYYEDDRLPARSDLAQQIMIIKPTLRTLESIVEPLSLKIKDFAEELKK